MMNPYQQQKTIFNQKTERSIPCKLWTPSGPSPNMGLKYGPHHTMMQWRLPLRR